MSDFFAFFLSRLAVALIAYAAGLAVMLGLWSAIQ